MAVLAPLPLGDLVVGGDPFLVSPPAWPGSIVVVDRSRDARASVLGRVVEEVLRSDPDCAVLVVSGAGVLVGRALCSVSQSFESRVSLLDFGQEGIVPSFNPVQPGLFPSSPYGVRCLVRCLAGRVTPLSRGLEDALHRGVRLLFDYNASPGAPASGLLSFSALPAVFEGAGRRGPGPTGFQELLGETASTDPLRRWVNRMPWLRMGRSGDYSRVCRDYVSSLAGGRPASALSGGYRWDMDAVVAGRGVVLSSVPVAALGEACASVVGSALVSSFAGSAYRLGLPAVIIADVASEFDGVDWANLLQGLAYDGVSLALGLERMPRAGAGGGNPDSGSVQASGLVVESSDPGVWRSRQCGSLFSVNDDWGLDADPAVIDSIVDRSSSWSLPIPSSG